MAVRTVLDEIGAEAVPELLVINKIDAVDGERVQELSGRGTTLAVSGRTGEGIDGLLEAIGDRLRALVAVVELEVPYERGDVLAALHRDGEVLVEVHGDAGTRVRARLGEAERTRFDAFVTG